MTSLGSALYETSGLHSCSPVITGSPRYSTSITGTSENLKTGLFHSWRDYSMMRLLARRRNQPQHQVIGKEVAIQFQRVCPVFKAGSVLVKSVFLNSQQNHPEHLLTMHMAGPNVDNCTRIAEGGIHKSAVTASHLQLLRTQVQLPLEYEAVDSALIFLT